MVFSMVAKSEEAQDKTRDRCGANKSCFTRVLDVQVEEKQRRAWSGAL